MPKATFRYSCMLIVLFAVSCSDPKHETWKTWTVNAVPVFSGQYPLSGDPSVIHDGSIYRMFYTGFDATRTPQGPEICQATSTDGINWTNVAVDGPIEGRMLSTDSNNWSNAHETSYILKFNGQYFLYFIGYQDAGGGVFGSGPVSIGVVTSTDGVIFTAPQADPIIIGTPDRLDGDALSSPTITTYHDSLVMIYAGFCYTKCGAVLSHLVSASSTDGIHWYKKLKPVISETEIPWASKGVAESEIVLGSDKLYYLFMTSVDEPHIIGVARANTPYGPWDVNPIPIVQADNPFSIKGAVAPSVIFEDGKARAWYHGFTSTQIRIGYAETTIPLKE